MLTHRSLALLAALPFAAAAQPVEPTLFVAHYHGGGATVASFIINADGTLTQARGKVTPEVLSMLKELRKRCYIGFVGGSDIAKQCEQLGNLWTNGVRRFAAAYYRREAAALRLCTGQWRWQGG